MVTIFQEVGTTSNVRSIKSNHCPYTKSCRQNQKPSYAWTIEGLLAVGSLGERASGPTVTCKTALAYPTPRLACSLSCTVDDCACQASWPFKVGCHAGVGRVALCGDNECLIEHRLNLRRTVRDFESGCVSHWCFAVVRRSAVCEIYYERRGFICTRHIASKEGRPRSEVLCNELPRRCGHRRERVR